MKVGDIVKIRKAQWFVENSCGERYVYKNGVLFDADMSGYCGETACIIAVSYNYYGNLSYQIDLDKQRNNWSDWMFELLAPEINKQTDKLLEILSDNKKHFIEKQAPCVPIRDGLYAYKNVNIDYVYIEENELYAATSSGQQLIEDSEIMSFILYLLMNYEIKNIAI